MRRKWGIHRIYKGLVLGWWRTQFSQVQIDHIALGLWEVTILSYPERSD